MIHVNKVYAVSVPELIPSELYHLLLSKVSTDKQNKIMKYRRREDAYRSLLGEVLIRAVTMKITGCSNDNIILQTNPYGKPILHEIDHVHFNLSHSGSWVVAIFSDCEVGIDVEQLKSYDPRIAEHFFSRQEYLDLLSNPIQDQESYFIDLWTLKESYIKARGMGLSIPLNTFTIRIFPDQSIHMFPPEPYFFKRYSVHPLYKVSTCSPRSNFAEQITFIDVETLYNIISWNVDI